MAGADFDNYDDDMFDPDNFEDNFDPDNATGAASPVRRKPASGIKSGIKIGAVGSFDITIKNTGAVALNAELFNYIRSIAFIYNASTNPTNYPLLPLAGVLPANLFNKVYFDETGALCFTKADGVIVMTIQCKQVPYKSLFNSSAFQPFKIEKLRYTIQNDAQFDNDLNIVNNSWLGKTDKNSISPRNFVSPNQFQAKIADIPLKQTIDMQSGIQLIVNAGEQVQMNFYTRAWKLQTM